MPKAGKPIDRDYTQLKAVVQTNTFWSGGVDYPWQGDALVSPDLLDRLCKLAAMAPAEHVRDFCIMFRGD